MFQDGYKLRWIVRIIRWQQAHLAEACLFKTSSRSSYSISHWLKLLQQQLLHYLVAMDTELHTIYSLFSIFFLFLSLLMYILNTCLPLSPTFIFFLFGLFFFLGSTCSFNYSFLSFFEIPLSFTSFAYQIIEYLKKKIDYFQLL